MPTDLDITQDTMLRLDVSNILMGDMEGTRLMFWAWQGDTMPVRPQITFDDPHRLVPTKGFPGFYVGTPTAQAAAATFGFMDVAAVPEPTSALLLLMGFLGATTGRRRHRPQTTTASLTRRFRKAL